MYNSITNDLGCGCSQPAFDHLFTDSTSADLEFSSNDMKTETEASSLMGSVTDCINAPVQRLHSADNFMGLSRYLEQGKGGLSISEENSMIIQGMMKVNPRYSPEEKRERIERYRSKRNLRNFNKKIQYECRKILADNRRRSKGRFVRKDGISTMMILMDPGSEDESWINLLDYPFPSQY